MANHIAPSPLNPWRLVNRSVEIREICAALSESDDTPRIFYFEADAGVGKTRLLRTVSDPELLKRVPDLPQECQAEFRFGGFYDFYETELHSNSRLEQRILDHFDPSDPNDPDKQPKYFQEYRALRTKYERARRLAPKPEDLEKMRVELGDAFVRGINEISASQKVLFCFDTLETLQYESDAVQRLIGEAIKNQAIETLSWLTSFLPRMRNVVVLLAGRPKKDLPEHLKAAFAPNYKKFPLVHFNDAYITEYLKVMAESCERAAQGLSEKQRSTETDKYRAYAKSFSAMAEEQLRDLNDPVGRKVLQKQPTDRDVLSTRIGRLTNGQPILLAFATDLMRYEILLPDEFKPDTDISQRSDDELHQDVKKKLMEAVMSEKIDAEVSRALPYIALARKGVTVKLLTKMMQAIEDKWNQESSNRVLETMRGLSYAKPVERDGQLVRMYLHDELYDWIGGTQIKKAFEQNDPNVDFARVCRAIIEFYTDERNDEVEPELASLSDRLGTMEPTSKEYETLLDEQSRLAMREARLIAEQLYYQLEASPREGYAEYSKISDRAIINHQVGLDMQVRDEMLRWFNLNDATLNNWRLKRAGAEKETRLDPPRINRGAAIRWVRRLIAQGNSAVAIEAVNKLSRNPEAFQELKIEDDPLFIANLRTYEGEASVQSDPSGAIGILNDAIEQFQTAEPSLDYPDLRETLLPRHLGRALSNRGYAYARENRVSQAQRDYQRALPLLRRTGLPHQTASTTINLAFAYLHTGHLLAAETLCRQVIRMCDENKLFFLKGHALNTLALVDLEADRPHRAIALTEQSITVFNSLKEGEDIRGLGLANLAKGEALRAMANLDIYPPSKTRQFLRDSEKALVFGLDTFKKNGGTRPEPAREIEARQELGCLYRQWARFLREQKANRDAEVKDYEERALSFLTDAIELVTPRMVGIKADILNDLGELYQIQENDEKAEEKLRESDEDIRKMDNSYLLPARPTQPPDPLLDLYTILGKNALLRGRRALREMQRNAKQENHSLVSENLDQAAKHFTYASAYFDRFIGDPSAKELAARRTYRIYRDLVNAGLSLSQLREFRHHVEDIESQTLFPPWPRRTTLSENFNDVLTDIGPIL